MKYEIIIREKLARAKLTIARDRVSLKFPQNMPVEERTKIEEFTKKIVENVGEVEFTLRGRFTPDGILLRRKISNEEDPNSSLYFGYKQFEK